MKTENRANRQHSKITPVECPSCSNIKVVAYHISHAFFSHFDFSEMRQAGDIGKCRHCGSVFRIVDEENILEIDRLICSHDYALSGQSEQTIIVDGHNRPATRSVVQAELLSPLLKTDDVSILDIGCFDGRLLVEFAKRKRCQSLHGFDINPHVKALFPRGENFRFSTSDLSLVKERFDLICISHVLIYINDLKNFMGAIRRLLKPDGLVMVQVPDVSKNPCYFLMGDQYHYFTVKTLKDIFNYFGFEFSQIGRRYFPREVLGVASTKVQLDEIECDDHEVGDWIKKLDEMAQKVVDVSTTSRVYVLGTTVNAAFVDSVLGERLGRFVDENWARVGKQFRGKDVYHPQALSESDVVIIPYGESGHLIETRFEKNYKGQFVVV